MYRLPTEAEWEYVCRAGTRTRFSFGDSDSRFGRYGWYVQNSGGTAHPVGQKWPNAWGFHDMHGNVTEWCQDWETPYRRQDVRDPRGTVSASVRVHRGGHAFSDSKRCRSAFRGLLPPDHRSELVGFRVVCVGGGAAIRPNSRTPAGAR